MSKWEKEFAITKLIVRAIYGSVLIYAGLIYFGIVPVVYIPEQTQQIMFFVLLASVPPMFFIGEFVGKQYMNPEKLAEEFRAAGGAESGLSAVTTLIRTGAIIIAATGEAFAVYGLVFYILSGNTTRSWIFLVLSIVHYPLTMMKLSRTRADIEHLSRSE